MLTLFCSSPISCEETSIKRRTADSPNSYTHIKSYGRCGYVCVCMRWRKRRSTIKINSDMNSPADWTQASAKFPFRQPSLGGRSLQGEFRACSSSLHQSYTHLTKTVPNGSPSKIFVFVPSNGCLCACIYALVVRTFTNFFLAKPALFFPLSQQILPRSKHKHTALLRQVSIILAHSHLGPWFPVNAHKSSFLFSNSEGNQGLVSTHLLWESSGRQDLDNNQKKAQKSGNDDLHFQQSH